MTGLGNAATVRRAAAIRAAVRAAVRARAFGEIPAGVKVAVRSGVDTIYVEIEGAPDDWSSEAGPSGSYPFGRRTGSAEACKLAAALAGVADEHSPGWTGQILLCRPAGNPVILETRRT